MKTYIRYKVNVGYRRNLYFSRLESAKIYCDRFMRRTKIVLSIVECKREVGRG